MTTAKDTSAPTGATDAVLKPSEPVPEGSREVRGIDFNQYAGRSITVEELVGGYANMGFQATSVGEAVRIINDMVSFSPRLTDSRASSRASLECGDNAGFGNGRALAAKHFSLIGRHIITVSRSPPSPANE